MLAGGFRPEPGGYYDQSMDKRTLGTQGLEVSAIGLGGMGMSEFYGESDETASIATIHRALEMGALDFVAKPKIGVADGLRQLAEDITEKVRTAAKAHVRRLPPATAPAGATPGTQAPAGVRPAAVTR